MSGCGDGAISKLAAFVRFLRPPHVVVTGSGDDRGLREGLGEGGRMRVGRSPGRADALTGADRGLAAASLTSTPSPSLSSSPGG